jgi:succinyl-diaminopimelate desuccinylase
MKLDDVIRLAEESEEEVAKLCSDLVKFNSAHPKGYTDDVVDFLKSYFDKHGVETEIHAKEPKKPNLVAKVNGEAEKRILWVGHLDVVPEGKLENWTYPPYSGTISDGRVWGRGSSDMKGACAAAMVSARILSKLASMPNNVEFWFTCDEEIGGGSGAKWLAETGKLKGDVCIIGDGNGGGLAEPSIDLGCKGGAATKLIARGKTAHGSTPFLGDNAIKKLIKGIPWVEKINDYKLDYPNELESVIKSSIDFFGKAQNLTTEQKISMASDYYTPSVTCNMIKGGVKRNVIPDYAEAEFDIRLTPGSSVSRVRNRIRELITECGIEGLEVLPRKEIENEKAGYFESPTSNFAKQFVDVVKQITSKDVNMKILRGGTDGISTSKIAGIPSLGYGTSLTGMAHEPDEYITIENLILGVKIYTYFPIFYN